MGVPAGRAAIPNDALDPRLAAFPSPASVTDVLESPTILRSLTAGKPSTLLSPRCSISHATTGPPLPSEPGAVVDLPVMTPPLHQTSETNMNVLVGGALAPVHTLAPAPRHRKPGPGLRLPSFEALGIAAPHPDRFDQLGLDGILDGSDMKPVPESAVNASRTVCGDLTPMQAHNEFPVSDQRYHLLDLLHGEHRGPVMTSPFPSYINTLTPPAEKGDIPFPSLTTISHTPGELHTALSEFAASASAAPSTDSATAAGAALPPIVVDHSALEPGQTWIAETIDLLIRNIQTAPTPSNPLRVLSHALPSPSTTGHIYPAVINAIHNSTHSSPTVWINVFHAIPGRFNLADLPTSPPSTPGPPLAGEDYFTQKVFDSAVPIHDYQEELSSLPRSPRPIVPPSSINISLVERYIPPTTPNEFADMFNPNGPSILVDRLVELSPNNGSLVFIYPTRVGAQTFMREYLAPILDPLLRSTCVVHGLSSDLSRILGSMASVDRMISHETMSRQVAHLCASLTQRSTSMRRFHGRPPRFTLQYATKKDVKLTREIWARDWWTKQEKPRVREVVTRYAQEAQQKSSNEHVDRPATPAELIQSLLDGVIKKPYHVDEEPKHGVEVSVFVITRSE